MGNPAFSERYLAGSAPEAAAAPVAASGEFEQYEHHGKQVFVRRALKGDHRKMCLCYSCAKFVEDAAEGEKCPIAAAVYANCVKFDIVSPVLECPEFQEVVDPAKARTEQVVGLMTLGDVQDAMSAVGTQLLIQQKTNGFGLAVSAGLCRKSSCGDREVLMNTMATSPSPDCCGAGGCCEPSGEVMISGIVEDDLVPSEQDCCGDE